MRPIVALRLAGAALLAGATIHVLALLGGPTWIAFLGAPPSIVASAQRGGWEAPAGTFAIAGLLGALSLCCLAAARGFRFPLQRPILAAAAGVFVLRGLLALPVMLTGMREWTTPVGRFVVNGPLMVFLAGSAVVLAIGLLIGAGLRAGCGGAAAGA